MRRSLSLSGSAFRFVVLVSILTVTPAWGQQCSPGIPGIPPGSGRPVILVTGYWPPTNEIARPFSYCHNDDVWIGENWDDRGYDIVSYFPELSATCDFTVLDCTCAAGVSGSDFRVDYQETLDDFEAVTTALNPVAIVTTSRTFVSGQTWEVEFNYFNNPPATWRPDCIPPVRPAALADPSLPPFALINSTLPVVNIVDSVDRLPGLNAFICQTKTAAEADFLSAYVGLLGVTYQRSNPECLAAGHIHVSFDVTVANGFRGLTTTLGVLIDHLEAGGAPNFRRGDIDGDGSLSVIDATRLLSNLFGPATLGCAKAADVTDDGLVQVDDAVYLLNALFLGSSPIPDPSETCGLDPTTDFLDCDVRCP